VPVIVFVFVSQYYVLFLSNHGIESMRQFYKEEPDSLDVVLIGASEVYAGFSPLYAYQEYGLTSYLYAIPSNPGWTYLAQIKEVIKAQHPQYIIIEMQGFLGGAEDTDSADAMSRFVENIPLSRHKLSLLRQLNPDSRLSALIPFIRYHGQWNASWEVHHENFSNRLMASRGRAYLKGESTETAFDSNFTAEDWYEDYSTAEMSQIAHESLLEILDYLDQHQLDNVLFARFPHKLVSDNQYNRFRRTNRAQEIIEERGYQMIDLEHDNPDISFDVMFDFYDREHLNHYGRIKLTEYICDLLTYDYELEPREQTPENREHWEMVRQYAAAVDEAINDRIDNNQDVDFMETPAILAELDARIRAWEEE